MKKYVLLIMYIIVTSLCVFVILFGMWQKYLSEYPLSSACTAEEVAAAVATLHGDKYWKQDEATAKWSVDYINSNLGTDFEAPGVDIWEVFDPETLTTTFLVVDFAGHEDIYDEFMQTIVPQLNTLKYNYSIDKNSLKFYGAPFDNYYFQRDMVFINSGVKMDCAPKPWQ